MGNMWRLQSPLPLLALVLLLMTCVAHATVEQSEGQLGMPSSIGAASEAKSGWRFPFGQTRRWNGAAGKVYVVTGANVGLGFETTRQLAAMPETKKVYMACRNEHKAMAAINALVMQHGIAASKLAFMKFDAEDDKATLVANAMSALSWGERVDGVILNAGGVCHIVDQIQINLIGNLHLLNALEAAGRLKPGVSRIMFSGSEAARGIPIIALAAPKMPKDEAGMQAFITGANVTRLDVVAHYGYVKGIAALYFMEWARRNPDYVVLTVSPGGTTGTAAQSHKALPIFVRMAGQPIMKFFRFIGFMHDLPTGAQRYVDAILGINGYDQYASGTYVASANGATGPVGDQCERRHAGSSQYRDVKRQLAAYNAIQKYL